MQVFHEYAQKYLDRMRERAAKQGAGSPPPKRIVDKMLRNAWHIGYIQMILPDACLLETVRHPLDTVLSCYKQPFEGRGTPWAWDLDGELLLKCLRQEGFLLLRPSSFKHRNRQAGFKESSMH